MQFETAELPAGRYRISVSGYGIGYEYASSPESWWFEVQEPEAGSIILDFENPSPRIDEWFRYSVYAPGADSISVHGSGAYSFSQDSYTSFLTGSEWFSEPGREEIFAEAYYTDSEGGTVQKRSETYVFQIAERGQTPLTLHAETTLLEPETDLSFSVYGLADSDVSWQVSVTEEKTGETVFLRALGDGLETPEDILVPGTALQPGHLYRITAEAQASGCEPASESIRLAVVPLDGVLRLPASLTEVEEQAFEGSAVKMVCIPAGVSHLGSRAFADCPDLVIVLLESADTVWEEDAFEGADPLICRP